MSLDDKLISLSDGIDALEERVEALEDKQNLKEYLKLTDLIKKQNKKIEALEKGQLGITERLDTHNNENGERFKEIKALESEIKDYKELVFDIQKKVKQLEGTTEYYDEKTLTHFISDIEDWIKTNKHEEFDGTSYWCVDVPGLEQFLIDRKKQMMRYNKTKMKEQLEGKQ